MIHGRTVRSGSEHIGLLRILEATVDDDAPVRRMLARTIAAEGYAVDEAGDGAAALIAVDRSVPVRANTKVGLEFQGLTGLASVSLTGGSADAEVTGSTDGPVTLKADPNATADVTTVNRLLKPATSASTTRTGNVQPDTLHRHTRVL